jgi:hypothetical protein
LSAIAEGADVEWRRVFELLELRESEQAILPDVEAIRKRQTVINERHRAILTEWLYEVRKKNVSRHSPAVNAAASPTQSKLSTLNFSSTFAGIA